MLQKRERVAVTAVAAACTLLCGAVLVMQATQDSSAGTGMDKSNPIGWAAVLGAIVIFGSFFLLLKSEGVSKAKPDPVVLQLYNSTGSAALNMLLLTRVDFVFSWWPVLGAVLWVFASLCSFKAVEKLGMAVGMALWAGLTVIVSFCWGAAYFGQKVNSWPGAVAAMLILIVGIAATATAGRATFYNMIARGLRAARRSQGANPAQPIKLESPSDKAATKAAPNAKPATVTVKATTLNPLLTVSQPLDPVVIVATEAEAEEAGGAYAEHDVEFGRLQITKNPPLADTAATTSATLMALAWPMLTGLSNGSMMTPFTQYTEDAVIKANGGDPSLLYLPCFALSAVAASLVALALSALVGRRLPPLHLRAVAPYALTSGLFWACGNFCTTYATQYLGNTIGFPLTQACIIVNGLWGILFYREITAKASVIQFGVSVVVILGSATLLVLFG